MKGLTHAAVLASGLAIAACASGGGYEVVQTDNPVPPEALVAPPAELAGTVIRAETLDGTVMNRVHFYPDGVIHIVPEDGSAAIPGTYAVQNNQLCLTWQPRGTECWPYERAFVEGQTVTLTSNRGQMARVTLVDDDAGLAARLFEQPAMAAPQQPATTTPTQTWQQPTQVATRAGERG